MRLSKANSVHQTLTTRLKAKRRQQEEEAEEE